FALPPAMRRPYATGPTPVSRLFAQASRPGSRLDSRAAAVPVRLPDLADQYELPFEPQIPVEGATVVRGVEPDRRTVAEIDGDDGAAPTAPRPSVDPPAQGPVAGRPVPPARDPQLVQPAPGAHPADPAAEHPERQRRQDGDPDQFGEFPVSGHRADDHDHRT